MKFYNKLYLVVTTLLLTCSFLHSEDSATKVHHRLREIEKESEELVSKVKSLLRKKTGHLQPLPGFIGAYHVIDDLGNIIAVFKPDDEQNWSPNNRFPEHRRQVSSREDIYFHQMSSFEQGQHANRQNFAKLIDFGDIAEIPAGNIVDLESDQFVDLTDVGLGQPPKQQTKRGYLQQYTPGTITLYDHYSGDGNEIYPLEEHSTLDHVPLNEFQKIGILDILLYNENRHPGNILLEYDIQGKPHIMPIENDSILPWKLNNFNSFLTHPQALEPFSKESLDLISHLDPGFIAASAKKMDLCKQSVINAKALALVVKTFAKANLTLRNIHDFIKGHDGDASQLWRMIETCQAKAEESLSKEDYDKYQHQHHVRWLIWWDNSSSATREDRAWLTDYNENDALRINRALDAAFWIEFKHSLRNFVGDASEKEKIVDAERLSRHITIGTTYVGGNPERDELSKLVSDTHLEYAQIWGLQQEVESRNLLKSGCTVAGRPVDCEAYWNKIALIRRWLYDGKVPPDSSLSTSWDLSYDIPEGPEEWYIIVDDDMPVTNMTINPYKAIDELREGNDTSIIIALDVINWSGNAKTAVNTGLMIVRKDSASRQFFDRVWLQRNKTAWNATHYCPTLGVCQKQHTLHEQEGFSNVLNEKPDLLELIVSVVEPRSLDYYSPRAHIALNTFHRAGCFYREQSGWMTDRFSYHDPESGKWRKGDWMGQTAGVPLRGWLCHDRYSGIAAQPIRLQMLQEIIAETVRDSN